MIHLVKCWIGAKLNVANLVFQYILHNHELNVFIYSHIIAHAFHCYLSCHHLSYTLLKQSYSVSSVSHLCRINTVPESEKPLVRVYYQTRQIVLSGHALKPIFSTSAGLPISNQKQHHHHVHHESCIVCQYLFVDISYYVCSLESITLSVKLHVVTVNVLGIVRESCHQLRNHWRII